jgi:hypothetical protein
LERAGKGGTLSAFCVLIETSVGSPRGADEASAHPPFTFFCPGVGFISDGRKL